jgi:sialate O-acetylesterase
MKNDFAIYTDKTIALINGWRQLWNLPAAPFLMVQLAPHTYSLRKKPDPLSPSALPLFWEAQNAAARQPHTGIALTNDLAPDPADIHPTNKKDVGLRLARLALAQTYGRADITPHGPRYQSFSVVGKSAVLAFAATRPLAVRDGRKLTGFTVAAADQNFFPAEATLDGDTVRVSAPEVSKPAAVRYGWHETNPGNLTDASGLPSPAFRTDTWEVMWRRPATPEDVAPKSAPAPKSK